VTPFCADYALMNSLEMVKIGGWRGWEVAEVPSKGPGPPTNS